MSERKYVADEALDEKDAIIAELREKLKDAQREVNNYRRHANECEGLAAKGDIDKVSLLEEIKDIKNDKELLDSQLYGFLQLEEECGGGDLRNYIAELKAENRRLKRALWLARAERAESEARGWYHSTGYCVKYDGGHTIKGALFGKGLLRLPDEWMKIWIKVEHKCRAKAEEYK